MSIEFHFVHMDSSPLIEAHAREKVAKLQALLTHNNPVRIKFTFTANHAHNNLRHIELHLSASKLNIQTHEEGQDMYGHINGVIDKMITLVKKELEKQNDHHHSTPKSDFGGESYSRKNRKP